MPDGSTIDPHQKVQSGTASTASVSHPLIGSTRTEPAMRNAADYAAPPVNIKITVPFLGRRFYFSIASGKERRSKERLALERNKSPFFTKSNITFVLIGAVIFYALTLGTFLVFAAL